MGNTITRTSLEEATRHLIRAAAWTGLTEMGEPLDNYITEENVPAETVTELGMELRDFVVSNARDVIAFMRATGANLGDVAHDFHLTRNRHGAGFWDRGAGEVGERLTRAAHVYGTSELVGKISDGEVASIYLAY